MIRFFKNLFNANSTLDYKSIDDPKTFQKPADVIPAKMPNAVRGADVKTPLLSKTSEGPKR